MRYDKFNRKRANQILRVASLCDEAISSDHSCCSLLKSSILLKVFGSNNIAIASRFTRKWTSGYASLGSAVSFAEPPTQVLFDTLIRTNISSSVKCVYTSHGCTSEGCSHARLRARTFRYNDHFDAYIIVNIQQNDKRSSRCGLPLAAVR